MWIFTLISFSCGFIAQVMSHDIKVNCHSYNQFPTSSANASASLLRNLSVEVEKLNGGFELHIRWAVNVDVSNKQLTGTRIEVDWRIFLCEYTPSFANANLTGLTLLWFKFNVFARPGLNVVNAANLPLPPVANGPPYKTVVAEVDEGVCVCVCVCSTQKPRGAEGLSGHKDEYEYTSILVALFGAVLAGSIVLGLCLILFKAYILASGDFSILPLSSKPPVSVLLVYPAECPAFQKTVVALAEFLHEHGGCSVAVDLWQQGQIAELGPMRWVAGQAKAADRVLIVCPQVQSTISCRSNHSFYGPSIPASANYLYPLVLNMVASHAKNPSELAMFWAVQLGKSQDDSPRSLPGELTACKIFSLTKDLNKLCRSLHNKKQDSLIKRRPHIFYNKKSTMKLQDAIGQLAEHQSSITAAQEHFNSVVITV
ncbi:unnamed protein product [Lota lota]